MAEVPEDGASPGPPKMPKKRVEALDGLRAFAILGIVVFHLCGISGLLTPGGDSLHERFIWTIFGNTLDIFFILSGFVLFLPVIRRNGGPGRISDFYIKRFARLQPEYWACLVVLVLMIKFIPVAFMPLMPTVGQFVLHVFDLQTAARMVDPGHPIGFWIDGALWLVPVIAGFYLVFPFVAGPFFRHIWVGLVVAALISAAWKLAPGSFPGFFQSLSGHKYDDDSVRVIALDQTPAFAFSFAAGMTAAWVYTLATRIPYDPWIRRAVIAAFVIGIPAFILTSIPFTHEALKSTTGLDGSSRARGMPLDSFSSTIVRSILILGIILGPLWVQWPFTNRPARWIADRSFGIYLIHLPVAFYAGQLLSLPAAGTLKDMAVWTIVVIPIAAAYATVSRALIGQPVTRYAENWIRRRQASEPVP